MELSNNLAENSMRPIALGRKNYARNLNWVRQTLTPFQSATVYGTSPPSSSSTCPCPSTELIVADQRDSQREHGTVDQGQPGTIGRLLADAFNERDELTKEVAAATYEENPPPKILK